MGLVNVYLNNVSFDYNKFYNDDRETIIRVRHMAWCNKFKQPNAC